MARSAPGVAMVLGSGADTRRAVKACRRGLGGRHGGHVNLAPNGPWFLLAAPADASARLREKGEVAGNAEEMANHDAAPFCYRHDAGIVLQLAVQAFGEPVVELQRS